MDVDKDVRGGEDSEERICGVNADALKDDAATGCAPRPRPLGRDTGVGLVVLRLGGPDVLGDPGNDMDCCTIVAAGGAAIVGLVAVCTKALTSSILIRGE